MIRPDLGAEYNVGSVTERKYHSTVLCGTRLSDGQPVDIHVTHPSVALVHSSGVIVSGLEGLSRLPGHPNIVGIIDVKVAAGLPCFVTPHVTLPTLRRLLLDRTRLTPEETVAILGPVASALDHAHGNNTLHESVNPENILVGSDCAMVAGFGLGRVMEPEPPLETSLFLDDTTYLSPEQVVCLTEPDGRSDTYSLGCVAFEMLADEPPYVGDHVAMALAHVGRPIPLLSDRVEGIPSALDKVFRKALAKSPDDRFGTAGEFSHAFEIAIG